MSREVGFKVKIIEFSSLKVYYLQPERSEPRGLKEPSRKYSPLVKVQKYTNNYSTTTKN
jgi:hypothetical protein